MTRNPLPYAICLAAIFIVTIHGQTGPIKIEAGTTQVVVRVPQGKVEIKRQGTRGTAAARPDPAGAGKTEIAYAAQQVKEPASDSFTYIVETGPEQEVPVRIEPPIFDLDREVYEKLFKSYLSPVHPGRRARIRVGTDLQLASVRRNVQLACYETARVVRVCIHVCDAIQFGSDGLDSRSGEQPGPSA